MRCYRNNFQTAKPTSNATPHSRGAMRPSCARMLPLENRGRRESRVLAAPAASCVKIKTHELVTARTPRSSGLPCAMVLTAYFVLSPVIGLSCHRRFADMALSAPGRADLPPRNLTPASRRQDHTTSPSASAPFVRALCDRSRENPPCDHLARPTLPRPPHPIPRP